MRSFLAVTIALFSGLLWADDVPPLEPVPPPGTTLEQWEKQREDIIRRFELISGPFPRPEKPVPLEPEIVEEVTLDDGIIRRKISYHTDSPDVRRTAYLMIPPTKPGQKRPAMIVFHSTQPDGKLQAVGLAHKPSRHIGLHLAQRGYVTIAPDYPSFGEFQHDFANDNYESGTMLGIYTGVRTLDLLAEQPEVDPNRMGAIGHSLGGHTSIFTALFEPRIKVIVSSCGFTRVHRYYEGDLTGWTSDRYFPRVASVYDKDPDKMPIDYPEMIAFLAPRPFFTNSPLHDSNFEVIGVRETMAASQSAYDLYGVPEAIQAIYPDCEHDFPPEAREAAYSFLDRYLKPDQLAPTEK